MGGASETNTRFLLVTVSDGSAPARANLSRLLATLARQPAAIELVLVMRGGPAPPVAGAPNLRVHAVAAPLETSLSRARNIALEYARDAGLLDAADVVAFPDDDCAYPDGLLERVAGAIGAGSEIVVGAYAPDGASVDQGRFPAGEMPLCPALTMRVVSSNNVFFSARVVAAVGDFDERLGLGARYGAAEDTDYVLRALRLGARGAYAGRHVFVWHPDKAHRRGQYYVGNSAVEAKHARRGGTRVRLARRLASGPALVARGEIGAREYARAVDAAIRMLRDRERG